MPEYPNTFPCPLMVGTMKLPKTFNKTEFEHSNRYRKTYKCDMIVQFEFLFDIDELRLFMTWYKVDLNSGSRWFSADWMILGDISNDFHFNKEPEFEVQDQYYKLKAEFNVRPRASS